MALSCCASAQVNVPLTVQEALWPMAKAKSATAEAVANAANGMARSNEPWTGGVPLPDSWNVSASAPQVSLTGVSMAQFKCLAVWPSGNCKWLLVDTQIPSLSAGGTAGLTLTSGNGNFGGGAGDLASDNGGTISVNSTGGRTPCGSPGTTCWTIRKAFFNGFDVVSDGNSTLIASGTSPGLLLQGPAADGSTSACPNPLSGCTTIYRSSADPSSTCSIEDNGPVRASIECHGGLKNGAEAYLNFQVRIYFYYGSSKVKLTSILKNASESSGSGNFASATKGFRSYEMRLMLNGLSAPRATFATAGGTQAHAFTAAESAYMWQGFSSKFEDVNWQGWLVGNTQSYIQRSGSAPFNYVMDGYQIDAGGVTVASGTRNQYQDGWADLSDASGKGITIGGYQFSSYWPKSLQFMSGGSDVRIGIWPDQSLWLNPSTAYGNVAPYWIPWPTYWMDTIYLNFHSAAVASPGDEILKMQEFLVGRAPYSHYNDSGVFFFKLNDPADTDSYIHNAAATCVPSSDIPSICPSTRMGGQTDFAPSYWHSYGWTGTGGSNQSDFPLDYLMRFYERGSTGRLLWGYNKTKYIMETALARADGFTWSGHSRLSDFDTLAYPIVPSENLTKAIRAKLDDLHGHIYGTIDYYYFTGDRTIKDFIDQAMGDRFTNPNIGPAANPLGMSAQRQVGIYLMAAARLHNYAVSTGNSTLAGNAFTAINRIFTANLLPDLAVSGTGTSTTHNSSLLPATLQGQATYGISRTRGIFFSNTSENVQGVAAASYNYLACGSSPPTVYTNARLAQPFEVAMATQGLDEALQALGPGWQYYQQARDLNLGMVEWALSEGFYNNGTTPDSGFLYSINLDHVCSGSGTPTQLCECAPFVVFSPQTVWFIHSLYLKYTGDTSKNDLLRLSIAKVQNGLGNDWDENGGYGVSNAIYAVHHPPETELQTVALDSFANNGDGSYTLHWTPASNTVGYFLKHSGGSKAIVDWLNFDIRSGNESEGNGGTFRIDPTANMPWFAAGYTSSQPAPNDNGITVSGLPANLTQSSFMLKADVSANCDNADCQTTSQPDYTLKAGSSVLKAHPGDVVSTSVTLSVVNGYAGNIVASCPGFSAEITCSVSPSTIAFSHASTASVTVSLRVGSNALAGVYTVTVHTQDSSGNPAHDLLLNLNVSAASDFKLTVKAATAIVASGGSATYTLQVSALGGSFNSSVALGCAGLPPHATASFTPATAVPGAGAATVTLVVVTSEAVASSSARSNRALWTAILLPGMVLSGFAGRRWGRKRTLAVLIGLGLLLAALVACGGGSVSSPSPTSPSPTPPPLTAATPAGTYTIAVIASSAQASHSTTLTLIVQ